MDHEEAARRELEAVRRAARDGAPRREAILPDPLALPPLPPSLPETYPAPEAMVGESLPESWYHEPSRSIAVWRDVWQRNVRFPFTSHRGLAGRLLVAIKRLLAPLFRAPLSADLERERLFHIAMLNRLEDLERDVRRFLGDVRDPYSFLRDRAVPDLVDRSDALFGILDRRIDSLEGDLSRLRDEGRSAGRVDSEGAPPLPEAAIPPLPLAVAAAPAAPPSPGSLFSDETYYAFESLHRGTGDEVRERQARYLEVFRGAPGRVVDLGCGRGEMLALLKQAGIAAFGVDANTAMVQACRRDGLEVLQGDAVAALAQLADGSLGGVFSAQTFEHWEREAIVAAVKLAQRKLAPGGAFVMETQNPRSIAVGASSFWRDPTHIRPIHPEAFEFLVRVAGFRSIEVLELAPWPEESRLRQVALPAGLPEPTRLALEDLNRVLSELDGRLYGFRDYAVIARR